MLLLCGLPVSWLPGAPSLAMQLGQNRSSELGWVRWGAGVERRVPKRLLLWGQLVQGDPQAQRLCPHLPVWTRSLERGGLCPRAVWRLPG